MIHFYNPFSCRKNRKYTYLFKKYIIQNIKYRTKTEIVLYTIKEDMKPTKNRLSLFESELFGSEKELICAWFTQEIFDALAFNTENQKKQFEIETKNLKEFLLQIENKTPKENLIIFEKYKDKYYILLRIMLFFYRDYVELIDFMKQPYVWKKSLQKYIKEKDMEIQKKKSREKFLEYVKMYGKYEYALMDVWKKLIELGIAEEREMWENWHLDEENTIVFTSKENHITTQKLPKTPYYRKKIA